MKTRTIAVIAALALIPGLVQGPAAAEPAADAPEVLQAVMKLEGRWQADAELVLGGERHRFIYTLDFSKTASGSGLLLDEHAVVQGVGELKGTSVIGFDPYEGRLHWFSVDNFGTAHNHVGELVGPGHVRLVHESRREGKPFREQIDLQWLAADRVEGRLVATLAGDVVETLAGTFTRVGR